MAATSIPAVNVTTEELERDPDRVLRMAEQARVTIFSGGVAVACLVSAEQWRDLMRSGDTPHATEDEHGEQPHLRRGLHS